MSLPELIDSLDVFFDKGLISDVLHLVRSGKEATVYCCRGGPSTDCDLVAAKIYKPLESRSFRNDAVYHAGRVIVPRRVRVAFEKKTRFGQRAQLGIWVESEYEALEILSAAGADVPRPIAHSADAVLMEYLGEIGNPAPALNRVHLDRDNSVSLFRRVLANVELFLRCDRVHGDLSPFNILFWDGALKIIDFPQAADARSNPNARALLERDVRNVCNYFQKFAVEVEPIRITNQLWRRYLRAEL
jgi:RIO kinase 1